MVRVRIGPSPTGDPHVGTAYIALFNMIYARQHGGQFVLRIEDTDQTRSRPEWEGMIMSALKWLGIQWDEGPDVGGPHGPYRQSERGPIYREHAEILLSNGRAYRCFCTSDRLDQLRKQQRQRNVASGYDGHCRHLTDEEIAQHIQAETPFVLRLKVPNEGVTKFVDRLRGEVSFDNGQIDDQVLLKSDGMPTYHLANVVDDHLMEITHVMRAEEWITSTPKHILLYEAFGWEPPVWIHMPLLRNADKSKISKRKNPVSLNYYKDAGFLPPAILNYLAMMGWTMPDGREKFLVDDMVANFSFDRISLGGPVFDIAKLSWLNGLYLRECTPEQMVEHLRGHLFSDARLVEVAKLVQERVDKLEDFMEHTAFFFNGDVRYDDDALHAMQPKGRTVKEIREVLEGLCERIDMLAEVNRTNIEQELRAYCESLGWKTKELFMPVRVAVTGSKATPPLFESMEVLGKERCRRRLRGAVAVLRNLES